MNKLTSEQLLIAAKALDFALRSGFFKEGIKENCDAWGARHAVVDAVKDLAAFEHLNFRPKVMLQMKRARDLVVGDVIVGRVGGAWRIVTGVEIIGGRPRGHVKFDCLYEGGTHWGSGWDKVTCQHYLFVVKQEKEA